MENTMIRSYEFIKMEKKKYFLDYLTIPDS